MDWKKDLRDWVDRIDWTAQAHWIDRLRPISGRRLVSLVLTASLLSAQVVPAYAASGSMEGIGTAPSEGTAAPEGPAEEAPIETEISQAPGEPDVPVEDPAPADDAAAGADAPSVDPTVGADVPIGPQEGPAEEVPIGPEDDLITDGPLSKTAVETFGLHPQYPVVFLFTLGFGAGTYGSDLTLKGYENKFAVERDTEKYIETYGSTKRMDGVNGDPPMTKENGVAGDSFCVFPSEAELGRIPDKEFDGWYVYKADTAATLDAASASEWTYDARTTIELPYLAFNGEVDGKFQYETYQDLGDHFTGLIDYSDGTETGNVDPQYGSYLLFPNKQGKFYAADVKIVGKWKESGKAEAAAKDGAGLTVHQVAVSAGDTGYQKGQKIQLLDESYANDAAFASDKTEYWARVTSEVESLDLDFNAYEIYYQYLNDRNGETPEGGAVAAASGASWDSVSVTEEERAGAPVTVRYSCDNGQTYREFTGLTGKMLPEWGKSEADDYVARNTLADPAHSNWQILGDGGQKVGIPLDGTENIIQVKVISPDGNSKKIYTFHVQKAGEPTMALNCGNTPAGVIMGSSDATWIRSGESPADAKAKALETFKTDRKYEQDTLLTNSTILYDGIFSEKAWPTRDDTEDKTKWPTMTDVDLDPTAIVMYQDTVAEDPGFTLTDVFGEKVSKAGTVKRYISLKRGESLALSTITEGDPVWYVSGGSSGSTSLESGRRGQVLTAADGRDKIDLRDLNILPGVYTIEYEYTDLTTGHTYNAEKNSFAIEKGRAAGFRRTLVVLPRPGDADMDGAVTQSDYEAAASALIINDTQHGGATTLNGMPLESDPTLALFAYRVLDLDRDGMLTRADLDELRKAPAPELNRTGATVKSDYLYKPLGALSEGDRPKLTVGTGDTHKATISMEYLGKESGVALKDGGYTGTISGPWNSVKTGDGAKVELGDTFWLGVKLEGVDQSALEDLEVDTFTLSLTYDSTYVEPAVVLSETDYASLKATSADLWQAGMKTYNLGSGSETVWGSTNDYDFTRAGSSDEDSANGAGKPFHSHPSKAVTPVEESAAMPTDLREVIFSVRGKAPQKIKDGYLFAVPFRLIKHPYIPSDRPQEMIKVELGAGMREFNLTTKSSAMAGHFALPLLVELGLVAAEEEPQAGTLATNSESATWAYDARSSRQDGIFGKATQNLAAAVQFPAAGAAVPLGEDKTEVIVLYNEANGTPSSAKKNAVYGEQFVASGQITWSGQLAEAPGWLTLVGNRLSGIPDEVPEDGCCDFLIGTVLCRIIVEKAPLDYYADNAYSYYGQTEFRGQDSPDFTFTYDKSQIKAVDLDQAAARGAVNSGKGADLAKLLGEAEIEPKLQAMAGNDPVSCDTDVGTYPIACRVSPKLKNYEFKYILNPSGGTTTGLRIVPRPFQVVGLMPDGEGKAPLLDIEAYTDGADTFYGQKAVLKLGQVEMSVCLPTDYDEAHEPIEGQYKDFPLERGERYIGGVMLPDDELELTYQVEILQNDYDKAEAEKDTGTGKFFLRPENSEEERTAKIEKLTLGGKDAKNYTLVGEDALEPECARAIMRVREVESIQINSLPKLDYTYGEKMTDQSLSFTIKFQGGLKDGSYAYSEETVHDLHLSVTWATEAQKEAGKPGTIPYGKGSPLETPPAALSGKLWLCLATTNKPENTVAYADKPLTVQKGKLTLTAQTVERFYGTEMEAEDYGFTYEGLAAVDKEKLADPTKAVGDGKELAEAFQDELSLELREALKAAVEDCPDAEIQAVLDHRYTAPTLDAVETIPEGTTAAQLPGLQKVTAETDASNTAKSLYITGAECLNYDVEYVYTNGQGATSVRTDYGASPYRISRRPIVVSSVTTDRILTQIYADTHTITRDNCRLELDEARLVLPGMNEDGKAVYYAYRNIRETVAKCGYGDTTEPVLVADKGNKDDLYLTYRATVVPVDAGFQIHGDISRGYFDMDDAVDGKKEYAVQLDQLKLEGSRAKNYDLVYISAHASASGLPEKNQTVNGIRPDVANGTMHYYPAVVTDADGTPLTDGAKDLTAKAEVILRPIESIELAYTGRTGYTYGESYAPGSTGNNGRVMQVVLTYARDPVIENDPVNNEIRERVSFQVTGYDENGSVTSFDDRDLVIHWYKDGDTVPADPDQLHSYHVLKSFDELTVAEHDGAKLFITGRRGEKDPLIRSTDGKDALSVSPRALTLTAQDAARCYGEADPTDLGFTFDVGGLAKQDQEVLAAAGLTGADGDRALQALAAERHFTYTSPTVQVDGSVTKTSDVVQEGKGGYPIHITGGALENYALSHEDATLHIFPRQIRVAKFNSGEGDGKSTAYPPLYTVFSGTDQSFYFTNVSNAQSGAGGVKAAPTVEFDLGETGAYTPDGWGRALPMTGAAVVGNDQLTLRVRVQFTSQKQADSDYWNVTVDQVTLEGGGDNGNYVLLKDSDGFGAIKSGGSVGTGKKEVRSAGSIEIISAPTKRTYTYGEELDLTGLVVRITYDTTDGEADKVDEVHYSGPDQFAQYGLYVNYYDSPTVKESSANYAKIFEKKVAGDGSLGEDVNYLTAASGDHLTIAPIHRQFKGLYTGSNGDFTANGKYLIVSGYIQGSAADVAPVQPQIVHVGANNTGDPFQIEVAPLALEFTLDAEDKTYDGDTKAAGTVTLKNAYDAKGVTDQIYLVTGADRESDWDALDNYATKSSFAAFVKGGYAFSTGTYVPQSGSVPFTVDGTIEYVDGYDYDDAAKDGALRFQFTDQNVAYQKTPGHDSFGAVTAMGVEVLGLKLAGPDAANYTLLGKAAGASNDVTAANVTTAKGYKGSSLPRATIEKAAQSPLTAASARPQAVLDEHTNAIRALFPQSAATDYPRKENGDHTGEMHYEYALQYVDETGALKQWAGAGGDEPWADSPFFGGEAVKMEAPEGYVPKEGDIPEHKGEDELVRGQVYPWAAEDPDGFVLDADAYPGGAAYADAYSGGYKLYTTARKALPRGTVFVPIVRAAETHNFYASPALSPADGYTPEMIEAAIAAIESGKGSGDAAIEAAKDALASTIQGAEDAAEAERAHLEEQGEGSGRGDPDQAQESRLQGDAVRTYSQRIDLLSVEERKSDGADSEKEIAVPFLEAVWFTDVLTYSKKGYMDAVARNSPTRYYGYFWDGYLSAALDFEGKDSGGGPLSLAGPIDGISIKYKDADGNEVEETISVNIGSNAQIYVNTHGGGGGGSYVTGVKIDAEAVYAYVGDGPMTLTVSFLPEYIQEHAVVWTSSDESVVKVHPHTGELTFVGVGRAVITARYNEEIFDTVVVNVGEDWRVKFPNAIFNFGKLDEFFKLDGSLRFWPERAMTRGEAATLLARFYVPNPNWERTGPSDFPDLLGTEYYAEAARLLGSVGVFTGLPDGTFAGDQVITRAEFATLLARMLLMETEDTAGQDHAFHDAGEEDTWAYSYIDALSRYPGIFNGVGDGAFAPKREITRAETAALMDRLVRFELDRPISDLTVPVDVKEKHWAFDAILRGVNRLIP